MTHYCGVQDTPDVLWCQISGHGYRLDYAFNENYNWYKLAV